MIITIWSIITTIICQFYYQHIFMVFAKGDFFSAAGLFFSFKKWKECPHNFSVELYSSHSTSLWWRVWKWFWYVIKQSRNSFKSDLWLRWGKIRIHRNWIHDSFYCLKFTWNSRLPGDLWSFFTFHQWMASRTFFTHSI